MTTVPQCSEYRTLLEALAVKDRLKKGIVITWVHSAAQMADALTKDMDASILRTFLRNGKCLLRGVDEILKQRSESRLRQTWMQSTAAPADQVCAHCQGDNHEDYICGK